MPNENTSGKKTKEQAVSPAYDKVIDDSRQYVKSDIDDKPPGGPPRTSPRQMRLSATSNEEPQLALFPGPNPRYKTITWSATAEDFVRYEGTYKTDSIITELSQIDVAVFGEGGEYYYQAGYRVLQKGTMMCSTGALPLHRVTLHLLDAAGAKVVTILVDLAVYGEKPGDTGPKLIRTKIPTPIEVFERSVAVWAIVPPQFEAGWMRR